MKYLILALLLSSCSGAQLLKKAERLIRKAEQKGAKWSYDTTFQMVKLKTDPIKVQFTPKPLIFNDTIVFRDTITNVVTKVLVREKTVAAATDCPPQEKIVKVPVTVIKTIKAKIPITWWDYIIGLIIAFAVGFVVRMFWPWIRKLIKLVTGM